MIPKKIFIPEKILSITKIKVENIVVYDLGIEKEHNYNANGIAVHNCITETNSAFNNGYIARLHPGDYVAGMSMPDACDFCATEINGQIFKVRAEAPKDYSTLDPNSKEYQKIAEIWEKEIWAGKNNFGRSTSKRKRVNPLVGNKHDNLREKEHHEHSMATLPAHPACRCRWIHLNPEYQWVDKDGQFKLRVEDEDEWERWYKANIE